MFSTIRKKKVNCDEVGMLISLIRVIIHYIYIYLKSRYIPYIYIIFILKNNHEEMQMLEPHVNALNQNQGPMTLL